MKTETLQEVARVAPPAGMAGWTLWGHTPNEWLVLLTIVYTVFLLVDKFPTVCRRLMSAVEWVKEKYGKSK